MNYLLDAILKLNLNHGMLVALPIPKSDEFPTENFDSYIKLALDELRCVSNVLYNRPNDVIL